MTGMGQIASEDEGIIFHRGQALNQLKDALADTSDDLLPLAVLHMVSLDVRFCAHYCLFSQCLPNSSGVSASHMPCKSMRKAFNNSWISNLCRDQVRHRQS
jgi:hypothetical protein